MLLWLVLRKGRNIHVSKCLCNMTESDLSREVGEETDFDILPEAVKCLPGFRVIGCDSCIGMSGAVWSLSVDAPSIKLMIAFLT